MSIEIAQADEYLAARTGKYEWRRVRYSAAGKRMQATRGLEDTDTVFDVGCGFTELDYCLRTEFNWKGRYIPVDRCIDGTNLEFWTPPRAAEWFVVLEVVEHMYDWKGLVGRMQENAGKGIVISTPNPWTTDVLGMDHTHVCEVKPEELEACGFKVASASFYGQPDDSLLAWWTK